MRLKQIFPAQYEILNELFDSDEIEAKYSRLNDIYWSCEKAWEKNLSRLKNIEIKYLLIGEAAPWTQKDKIRYFYKTFDRGKDKKGNDKPINWIRGLWKYFYSDSPDYEVNECLDMLAQKKFLIIDSLPFAMKYTSIDRVKPAYGKLVKSCSEYFFSKLHDKRIKWSSDRNVKLAFAFKLNAEALIKAFPEGLTLPSGQHISFTMDKIAATKSGFPTRNSLKEKWDD